MSGSFDCSTSSQLTAPPPQLHGAEWGQCIGQWWCIKRNTGTSAYHRDLRYRFYKMSITEELVKTSLNAADSLYYLNCLKWSC